MPSRSRLAELLIIGIVCAGPWMFGAVDAWAELILEVGIGLAAALLFLLPGSRLRWSNIVSLPSLALGGLILLALAQATPIPSQLLRWLDPSWASLRNTLLPESPERIVGDPFAPVPLPAPTMSQDPGSSLDMAMRLTAAWILFQAVMSLEGGLASLRRIGWAVATNAVALSLFALVQSLTWNGKIYWYFPTPSATGWSTGGPFVCHSHLAEYLNLGLGFTLGTLLGGAWGRRSDRVASKVWAAYAAGVLILGIVTSHSRGGFLGMLVLGLASCVGIRSRTRGFWLGLAGIAGLVLLFLVALGESSSYSERLKTILDPSDHGYGSRLEVWSDGVRAWRSHPVFGSGLGSFGSALIPFSRQERHTWYAHAENEYVELLVEGGLVGVALAILFIVGLGQSVRSALSRSTDSDRALVVGVGAGVVAVLLECCSDFGLHIPGVAVVFVTLCACLTALGTPHSIRPTATDRQKRGSRLAGQAMLGCLIGFVLTRGVALARSEAWVAATSLPPPGSELPTPELAIWPREKLVETRSALESAVRLRPDWAEGRLRLGLVGLALYRSLALEWLDESIKDPTEADRMADPLWLIEVARQTPGGAQTLIEHPPVHDDLVPAARSFLEARRCCPVSAITQAELGAVAFLFEPKVSAGAYSVRAAATAGANTEVLLYAARVASRGGDEEAAITCWQKALLAGDAAWRQVAAESIEVLPPDRIRTAVIPANRGRYLLYFSDQLFAGPEQQADREAFLRSALEQLPADDGLSEGNQLKHEAEVWAGLKDRTRAQETMERALALDPKNFEWRTRLIELLLSWGDFEEAHQQALVCTQLHPELTGAQKLLDQTRAAVVSGSSLLKKP